VADEILQPWTSAARSSNERASSVSSIWQSAAKIEPFSHLRRSADPK
jgi:hypothetical protein